MEYSKRDLPFYRVNALGLVTDQEKNDRANNALRNQVKTLMTKGTPEWNEKDVRVVVLRSNAASIAAINPQTPEALAFINKLLDTDQARNTKWEELSIRDGDIGPSNYQGSSCWCDSSIAALFMSTTKTDYILITPITKLSWGSYEWIDSVRDRASIDSEIEKRNLYDGNRMRKSLRSLVEEMRTQQIRIGSTIHKLRESRTLPNSEYSNEMKRSVETVVNVLSEFGFDAQSSASYKDSVEVLTFLPNIFGAPEIWHPICTLERKARYAKLPDRFFDVTVDSDNRFIYKLKDGINEIRRSDYKLFRTKDGKDFDVDEELYKTEIVRDVVHLLLTRDDVMLGAPRFSVFKRTASGLTLQELVDNVLNITTGSVDVITSDTTTAITYLIDHNVEVTPVDYDLPNEVPCRIFRETKRVAFLPEVLVLHVSRRGNSESDIDTTRIRMFDGGHALVKIKQGNSEYYYELVGSSQYYGGHYTAYIRPRETHTWFLFDDMVGKFSSVGDSTAEFNIETKGYFLVLERLS